MSNVTFDLPPLPAGNQPTPMQQQAPEVGGPREGDDKLYVKFYSRADQDGAASREAGRPVFKDTDYVRIHIPGDKNNVIDTKVTPQHKARFPRQWALYQQAQAGATATPEGTLLAEWPAVTRAQAEEMKYLHIFTVEQLATLPDQYGSRIMGFYELRRKAAAYLERSKDEAAATKWDDERRALNARIDELQKLVEQATAPKKESKRESARSGAGGE